MEDSGENHWHAEEKKDAVRVRTYVCPLCTEYPVPGTRHKSSLTSPIFGGASSFMFAPTKSTIKIESKIVSHIACKRHLLINCSRPILHA